MPGLACELYGTVEDKCLWVPTLCDGIVSFKDNHEAQAS